MDNFALSRRALVAGTGALMLGSAPAFAAAAPEVAVIVDGIALQVRALQRSACRKLGNVVFDGGRTPDPRVDRVRVVTRRSVSLSKAATLSFVVPGARVGVVVGRDDWDRIAAQPFGIMVDGRAFDVAGGEVSAAAAHRDNAVALLLKADFGPGDHAVELVFPSSAQSGRAWTLLGYVMDQELPSPTISSCS